MTSAHVNQHSRTKRSISRCSTPLRVVQALWFQDLPLPREAKRIPPKLSPHMLQVNVVDVLLRTIAIPQTRLRHLRSCFEETDMLACRWSYRS